MWLYMVILYRDVLAESRGIWKIEGVMLKFYSGSIYMVDKKYGKMVITATRMAEL